MVKTDAMEALKLSDYGSSKMKDDIVVKRILSGEKELFEILMRRCNQTLYRIVRSYLAEESDVEDAMQNTYLKAFDKLQQFQGHASFSTWLIKIGINESLLTLREIKKNKNLYAGEKEAPNEKIIQLPDSKQMNPEKLAIRQETIQLIERAIDQLPEKYRVIYVLKEIEGLDNKEIQNCLGISDSNIKVRLHRAKSLLKEALYNLHSEVPVFQFGNSRCDLIVSNVMKMI
jgi:RNA polymerase sigma-70 factor (ECF subfamily)